MAVDLRHIVIVGASLAGLTAARTVRRAGFGGTVTLLGAESEPPYKRPPLSKEVLAGKGDPALVRLRMDDDLGLNLRLGEPAVGLDLDARAVLLAGGQTLTFDGLVIATGAEPINPWKEGELDGVYTLRTLGDGLMLRDRLARANRVVIVGAGFVGAEIASVARGRGLDVTVVEALPTPNAVTLGHRVGAVMAALHRDNGVHLRLGVKVVGLEGNGHVSGVRLESGEVLAADLVVIGVGVAPSTGWLEGSGAALDHGVVCNATCTVVDTEGNAIEGVVAAGDVARWHNPLFGEDMRVEHWDNAISQGRAAGRRLLGETAAYAPVPYFWSDQYDTKIQFVGAAHPDDDVVITEGGLDDRAFVAAYSRRGRAVGALAMNMPHRLGEYRRLVAAGEALPSALEATRRAEA